MMGVPRIPEPREWILTKRCTRCHQIKPWAKFPPCAYFEDGSVRSIQPSCHDCNAAAFRRAEKRPQTHRNEYKAEWARRRRRQAGASPRIAIEPLRDLLQRKLNSGMGMVELEKTTGVPERVVYRLLNESKHVTVRLADTILTHLGYHLYDLYPELTEMAA